VDRFSRVQFLNAGIAALIITTILTAGMVQAQADKPIASPWAMAIDLALDPPAAANAAGPFYASGMLYRVGAGTAPIGAYHSWGWRFDPARAQAGTVATSSFEIAGQGEIVVSGVDDGRMTITGGTGDFRGVTGQAVMLAVGPNTVRVTFDLVGAGNGPN